MTKTPRLIAKERNEFAAIYAQLDIEWRAAGKTTAPERMPFEPDDIIELRKLTLDERIKGLRAYAWASDHITASQCEARLRPARHPIDRPS